MADGIRIRNMVYTVRGEQVMLNCNEGYLVGASLKDAGKRSFGIAKLEDKRLTRSVLSELRS